MSFEWVAALLALGNNNGIPADARTPEAVLTHIEGGRPAGLNWARPARQPVAAPVVAQVVAQDPVISWDSFGMDHKWRYPKANLIV